MQTSVNPRTIYEDWQDRRRLLSAKVGTDNVRVGMHLKILDYLVNRYQGNPDVHRPARFQMHSRLVSNDRRILVHQYLGRGEVAGVKNSTEAADRVASILQRMSSDDRPEEEGFVPEGTDRRNRIGMPIGVARTRNRVLSLIDRNIECDWLIWEYMRYTIVLPEQFMRYIGDRLSDALTDDVEALDILLFCENKNALDYAVEAWQSRAAADRADDEVLKTLEDYVRAAVRRPMAQDKLRIELANENPLVRLAATEFLEEIGELQDVGLMSDLLLLEATLDEDPRERDALLRAMRRIAERLAT